jgi:hypothetical protein
MAHSGPRLALAFALLPLALIACGPNDASTDEKRSVAARTEALRRFDDAEGSLRSRGCAFTRTPTHVGHNASVLELKLQCPDATPERIEALERAAAAAAEAAEAPGLDENDRNELRAKADLARQMAEKMRDSSPSLRKEGALEEDLRPESRGGRPEASGARDASALAIEEGERALAGRSIAFLGRTAYEGGRHLELLSLDADRLESSWKGLSAQSLVSTLEGQREACTAQASLVETALGSREELAPRERELLGAKLRILRRLGPVLDERLRRARAAGP